MEMKLVNSSQIEAVGWSNNNLLVRFKGGSVYLYEAVDKSIYDQFISSESKGHFLAESIKNKYNYTKLN